MFNLYTVSFFGHREIADYIHVLHKAEHLVRQLLESYTHVEFLVGRNGDFDEIATAAVRGVRQRMGEERVSNASVCAKMRENDLESGGYGFGLSLTPLSQESRRTHRQNCNVQRTYRTGGDLLPPHTSLPPWGEVPPNGGR